MDKISAGIISSGVAELVTLPICTVKTVYQSQRNISYLESARLIYQQQGLFGFYRASIPAIGAQIFASTYKLAMFEILREHYRLRSQLSLILAGVLTSFTCLFFTHPMDYVRVSLQTGKPVNFTEIYKGFTPGIAKAILGGAMYLPLRQIIIDKFGGISTWKAGLVTAVVGTVIVHPFDYLKTFMLANVKGEKLPFRNPYRGIGINLLRIVPHFVIMTETMKLLK